MSDTPRTDSVTFKAEFGMMPICDTVPAVFARTLERELNEACDVLNFRRELYALQTEQLDKVRGERDNAKEQRDRLAEAVNAATVLITAKGRHNTMLAYEGLRKALTAVKGETL